MIRIALAALIIVSACGRQSAGPDPIPEINSEDVVSGYTFLTAETQAAFFGSIAVSDYLKAPKVSPSLAPPVIQTGSSARRQHSQRLILPAAR
jgi:hypothetical protein